MNEKEAWNVFALTGSVSDYLNFKSLQQNKAQKAATEDNENQNNGTDNQTTEYR